ncbi:MAG: hypothetical protein U5K79_14805 [Cyclobacteriaceae bacterium]|nr:hypothetical protein [Cyclobacteriaceae bacterium]
MDNNHAGNKKELSPDEESKIRQAFKEKDWNEIKSNDSWSNLQ